MRSPEEVNRIEYGEPVALGKGKLEFKRVPTQPGLVQQKISGTSFWGMYQIAVGYDGRLLLVVPPTGLGAPMPPYPKPSMLAWILSDQQGMWGRTCPFCKSYFRTNHILGPTFCPYCSGLVDSLAFVTEAQRRYLTAFCTALNKAQQGPDDVTIDLETVTDSNPEWQYTEQRQQFHFTCSGCNVAVDILGDYGRCPKCGRSNAEAIIDRKLKSLETAFDNANQNLTDKNQRGETWDRLTVGCISEFKALGNHLRYRLQWIPATPKRKKELKKLSFQRVLDACESLDQWYGLETLEGVSDEQKVFLKMMLHRRHIITHNGGRVDADYLKFSGDTQAKLNERIHVQSSQVRRLLEIVRLLGNNLIWGVHTIA